MDKKRKLRKIALLLIVALLFCGVPGPHDSFLPFMILQFLVPPLLFDQDTALFLKILIIVFFLSEILLFVAAAGKNVSRVLMSVGVLLLNSMNMFVSIRFLQDDNYLTLLSASPFLLLSMYFLVVLWGTGPQLKSTSSGDRKTGPFLL